jgi:hypothetical protein
MKSGVPAWRYRMGAGLGIGAISSMIAAVVVCGIFGLANERGFTGIDPDDISLGFAEYSIGGMIFFGVPICCILGGSSGALSGLIGGTSGSKIGGILAALVAVPVLLLAACFTFGDPVKSLWNPGSIAWATSSAVGAAIAGVYCASRDPARAGHLRCPQPLPGVEDRGADVSQEASGPGG